MLPTFITLAAILALSPSATIAECTREALLSAASSYIAAQAAGDPISDVARSLLATPYPVILNRSTAATTGDLFFDAKKTLGNIQRENWGVIPKGKRPSRDLLNKVSDMYLDMWD
ncbi:hypothetical protein EK21DRAFT_115480 [Setomelanomma holmii]|uniref:Uncharacterized protein n=1 Tax=Setomelanomma holmii TaxID=210430 RepID=A0A9P4H433_9PLEO|nr:hypothetical protein EK21DRAFT_115480 [Setomelanomma holmii]